MEEYTNSPVADERDLDSIDFDAEMAEPQTEPAEEAEAKTEELTVEAPAAAFRVKYNGEEKDLTHEEAIQYAQMGMNYTKIKNQLDELTRLKAKDSAALVNELADAAGMTTTEYIAWARKNAEETALAKELEKILNDSPDISDDLANELAKNRIASRTAESKARREASEVKPWEALASAYPDIKSAEDIPESVRDEIGSGKDPLLAMREHEIANLRKEIESMKEAQKAQEQNAKNRQNALGSFGGAEKDKPDPIVELFLSDDY
jgi:hypothetical protein